MTHIVKREKGVRTEENKHHKILNRKIDTDKRKKEKFANEIPKDTRGIKRVR